MELVTIKIKNWGEWNPRKDIRSPRWFAMSNRITEDDQIQTLTDREFRAFVHILCVASQANKDEFQLNLTKCTRAVGIPKDVILKTLEKLTAFGICTEPVRDPYATLQDKTLQDTTRQNTDSYESASTVPATAEPPLRMSRSVEIQISSEHDLAQAIPEKTQARWMALYPDAEFLRREILKAFNWYENNSIKKPKTVRGWVSALSRWFERGWKHHVRTIPGAPGSSIDWEKVFGKTGGAA